MSRSVHTAVTGQTVKNKRFKTTRMRVEKGEVQICIRHRAGQFDLTLMAPLSIDMVQPDAPPREAGRRTRSATTGAKHGL
jgi:hypothetical protein